MLPQNLKKLQACSSSKNNPPLFLLFCYIPGVASQNWRRLLATLNAGLSNTEKNHFTSPEEITDAFVNNLNNFKLLSKFSKKDIIQILYDKEVFRFMFVRDPFARLVSSYRNKFKTKNDNQTSTSNFDDNIISNYYADHINQAFKNETLNNPDHENEKEGGLKKEIKHIDEDQYLVTFQAFVKYLTANNTIQHNEHWDQYYDLCYPCYIKYDFIGRLEHLQEESQTFLRKFTGII